MNFTFNYYKEPSNFQHSLVYKEARVTMRVVIPAGVAALEGVEGVGAGEVGGSCIQHQVRDVFTGMK